jgi:hypothetical protein
LHSLWDGLLGNDQKYRGAGNLAIELRNRPDFAREKLTELKAAPAFALRGNDRAEEAWCKESVTIAQDVVYAGGTLKGGTDRSNGPVLPDGYAKQVAPARARRWTNGR